MKPIVSSAIVVATALASGSAFAQLAGITGSPHDLSSTTTATNEICVFCHTPHGADLALGPGGVSEAPPLWNRSLQIPTGGYQRYSSLGTATLDGAETAVGSVSLACLSCHDGTQAMDSVINAPGSGGYNPTGGIIGGGPTQSGSVSGIPFPQLGQDLRDDHPISIEYAGGSCTGTTGDCTPDAATGDPDFNVAQHAVINGQNQWWVDVDTFSLDLTGTVTGTGTANVREKTDMMLYTRDFGGSPGPSVECASCHDPHEAEVRPTSFLRISNIGSEVCLACHAK
jgi:predicted CXXCH cytochrome family protein